MTQPDIRHLSGDDRRQLALGAASVFERTAFSVPSDSGPRADGFVPTDQALSILRTWIQAFSPGDPEAFERRLTWDDLTLADVARALSTPPATVLEPDWLQWVEAIAAAARDAADDRARGPVAERFLFASTDPPPFFDLLVPVLRAAKPGLGEVALDRVFGSEAQAALEAHLLRNAAIFAELALLDEFRAYVAANRGGYAEFVGEMLGCGLVRFLLEYPVLARQLAILASRWAAATAELATRLEADRPLIAQTFAGGGDLGKVTAIEPALSDPHHGGRRVAVLTFEHGLRLVYKPRSVALDKAFHAFLSWTADRGLLPAQRQLRTLDRGEYGWVEFVTQEAFESGDEVRDYYHRAGALLCLAYVLRAKDLHMENVIATREGPVLIDLELALQPVTRSAAALPASSAVGDHADTDGGDGDHCLTSGLLTLVESSGGHVFDIGGLRGTGSGTSAVSGRVWHGLDTDAINFTEEKTFQSRVRNAVVLDGAVQTPEAWSEAVERGFTEAYRFLLSHRAEILAPGGPLARLAGCPTRVLPRPTTQYATLSFLLARPQYQKDGCRWSSALDALNRSVSQSHDRPEVWPVLVAERRSLELLDVPHFTVLTDQTAVHAGHRLLLDGYFVQSGLDAVSDRLQRLSAEHLAGELERVRGALAVSIHSRFTTEPVHDEEGDLDVTSPEFLAAHALWIAHELLARSAVTERGREWTRARSPGPDVPAFRRHHLYDGTTGPALFLAAVAAETGDVQWATAAREVLGPLRLDMAHADPAADDLGIGSGLGSIVYALAMTGSLLEDPELTDLSSDVAAHITPARIAADTALDLVAGCAGAALGLLALHRLTRDADLLERAVRCGERLIETAVSFEGGSGWRTADGRVFTGLAHGVAGIAYALGRLHDATGDRRFGRAAAGGYRYVASRFLEGSGNWPILGEPVEGLPAHGPMMTAWCHGAPGIALATAAGTADTVDPRLLEELEAALRTAAAASPHKADHVCCGNMGRCESLFTAGRRLMRRDAFEGARRLARVVIARARNSGHFRLTANGFEYRIFDHGFFRGVSGIGYSLLHLASPAHLPSVAAFEAPPAGTARNRVAPSTRAHPR